MLDCGKDNQCIAKMNDTIEVDFLYHCQKDADYVCAETCVSLDACQDCECAVVEFEAGGPWGSVMDVRLKQKHCVNGFLLS